MLKYQCCCVNKNNKTFKYYSEIEKPEKYIVFNSLNDPFRYLDASIWQYCGY